jgi:hypothetical protein
VSTRWTSLAHRIVEAQQAAHVIESGRSLRRQRGALEHQHAGVAL